MCFLVVYSLIIAQNRRRANFRNHECQPKLSINAYSLVLKDPHSPVVIGAAAWWLWNVIQALLVKYACSIQLLVSSKGEFLQNNAVINHESWRPFLYEDFTLISNCPGLEIIIEEALISSDRFLFPVIIKPILTISPYQMFSLEFGERFRQVITDSCYWRWGKTGGHNRLRWEVGWLQNHILNYTWHNHSCWIWGHTACWNRKGWYAISHAVIGEFSNFRLV